MNPEVRIKRGDALAMQMAFEFDDGSPVDLTNATVAAQIRTASGDLVCTLPLQITDTPGVVTVTVPDTSQWPIGMLRGDVVLTAAGLPVHTETYGITVTPGVTR